MHGIRVSGPDGTKLVESQAFEEPLYTPCTSFHRPCRENTLFFCSSSNIMCQSWSASSILQPQKQKRAPKMRIFILIKVNQPFPFGMQDHLLQPLSCVLKNSDSSSNCRRKIRQKNRTTQPGDLRQCMSSASPPYTKSPQKFQLSLMSPGTHLRPLSRNHNCRYKIRIRPRPLQWRNLPDRRSPHPG